MSIKREAKFGLLFRHWLKASNFSFSAAFELKQTTTDSLPFSDVKDHQLDALLAVRSRHGLLYKAPDDSLSTKPFDYFYLKNTASFIVIKYPKCFVVISVLAFIEEKKTSKRKSLTSKRAKEIGIIIV